MVSVQCNCQPNERSLKQDSSETDVPKPYLALVACDVSPDLENTVGDLRKHGFMTVVATSVMQAVRLFPKLRPHIVIAHAELSNFGWLKRRTAETGTPLVLVGSPEHLLSEEKTDALEAQILAPARAGEIATTAEALVSSNGDRGATDVLVVGSMRLDTARRIVSISGSELELPPREFALLLQLTLHRAAPLAPAALAALAWPDSPFATAADVYRHVYALRALIGNHGSSPVLIRARRGVGYQLEVRARGIEAERS